MAGAIWVMSSRCSPRRVGGRRWSSSSTTKCLTHSLSSRRSRRSRNESASAAPASLIESPSSAAWSTPHWWACSNDPGSLDCDDIAGRRRDTLMRVDEEMAEHVGMRSQWKGSGMSWDFETDAEFEAQLQWMREFVREEIEPLDVLWPDDVYSQPQREEIKLLLRPQIG